MLELSLSLLPYEDKSILSHLIQLYRYDSSEWDGHVLNEHGLYLYKYLDHQWTDDFRRPFLVKVKGEIAGFALVILDVPREYTKISTSDKTNVISDFFIMRRFRRQGIGKQVAFQLFNQYKGVWEVKQTHSNKNAQNFWGTVIKDYMGSNEFREEHLQNEKWDGPVILFEA